VFIHLTRREEGIFPKTDYSGMLLMTGVPVPYSKRARGE